MSLKIYRLDWKYKFLEAFIGSSSLLFLFFVTVLSFIAPYPLAIFLIIYSFLMILRLGFHLILAISAYKNLTRFDAVDWTGYLKFLDTKPTSVELETKNSQLKKQFATNENWHNFIDAQATNYNLLEPKFQQPNSVVHFLIFSTYNESSEVLTRGLLSIFENGYDLSHLFVFVSQEERAGAEFNRDTRNTIGVNDWIQILEFSESDLNAVYAPDHPSLNYTNSELKNKVQSLDPKKLTIIFTQHPDGLDGEIIGKAANEDWAARHISLLTQASGIDSQLCILTSFDADSRVGKNFFQILSYRYCLTIDRLFTGFQAMPIFSNNLFDVDLLPFLVGVNTTFWTMIQYSSSENLHFFANYSVPLVLAQNVDFWQRDVIAEDALFFSRCLVKLGDRFHVVPAYNYYESDNVDAGNIWDAVVNQYKQLRRWAWGGVESFPYKFYHFFVLKGGDIIDVRHRMKLVFMDWFNHFCWSTLPITFSLLIFLPTLVNQNFGDSTLGSNLYQIIFYFSAVSYISVAVITFIVFSFIYPKAFAQLEQGKVKWQHKLNLLIGILISPSLMLVWGPPAMDAQVRGILGRYMGYWVTPKK